MEKEKERRRAARRIFAREQKEDRLSSLETLSLQQRQYILRSCVGLRKRRYAGLQQDLRLGQVGGFGGQIGVADARLGRRLIGQFRLRQVDGVGELVFASSYGRLCAAERGHRVGQGRHCRLRRPLRSAILDVAPVPTSEDVTVVFGSANPRASAVPAAPPRTSCPILTLKVDAELLENVMVAPAASTLATMPCSAGLSVACNAALMVATAWAAVFAPAQGYGGVLRRAIGGVGGERECLIVGSHHGGEGDGRGLLRSSSTRSRRSRW